MSKSLCIFNQNEKWLTDISEFACSKEKLYLSIIRNCFNDEIGSCKIGDKPTATLANDTLTEAIKKNLKGQTLDQ